MSGLPQTRDESLTAALDSALDAAARRLAPGGIAAIVRDGDLLAARPFGRTHLAGPETTTDTVFRIASMTKSFLAACALALRDEGVLDLTAPITDYAPAMAAARYRGRPVRITLADLLANRSGLGEDNAWGDEHLGVPREDIHALVAAGLRLTAPPAEVYQYSNVGMSLVGRAIEAVTGRDVERVISDRILDPLGLTQTRWRPGDYGSPSALARGHRTFDAGATFAPEPYVGSGALACIGGLFSTVGDIARWVGFLASTDDTPGTTTLSAQSRRELQRAHTVIPTRVARFAGRPLQGSGYGYGLVVEHDEVRGRTVGHAGGLPGFASHMRWQASSRIGVVAFGSSDEFPAWRVTAAALESVGAATTPRPGEIWPETLAAAERLDAIVRAGAPIAAAENLFSTNVLRDVPGTVRDRRIRELVERVGAPVAAQAPLAERIRATADDGAALWVVATERGALRCEVRLMGLASPVVQSFSITDDAEA